MDRRRELDSVRGLAAFAVVLYHTLALNSGSFQAGLDLGPIASPIVRILAYSPLHIVWIGAEAVIIFFVLSGFVLTRSAMKTRFSWEAYYPSRLFRLYAPMVGAIILTWVIYRLADHSPSPLNHDALSPVLEDYPGQTMLLDATLLGGNSVQLGVLWSLQWEVIFSLMLPVYIMLGRYYARAAGMFAALLCLAGWYYNVQAASYLPMFFIGTLLATRWTRIASAFKFLGATHWRSVLSGTALLSLSACGITSYFVFGRWIGQSGMPARVITIPFVLLGVVLLLILVQEWPPLRAFMTRRVFTALGTISFSLYLVHRPIVIAAAYYFHPGRSATAVGIVASVVVAVVFYYVVEKPAHGLSRRIAAAVRARETHAAPEALAQRTG